MKRLFLFLVLAALSFSGFTQRVYFLYIQSESSQPFYIKLKDKIHSSASTGYLILSHLRDSTYDLSVGFPGKNMLEQNFSVKVSGKDHGYLLKNFEEKGWGLFDLQTAGTVMANNNIQSAVEKKEPFKKDESAFTQILAKASDDSTLLEKPEPKLKEEKKTEVAKEEVKTPAANGVANQPGVKTEAVKPDLKPLVVVEAAKQPEKTSEIVEEKKTEPIADKPVENKIAEQPPVQIKEEPQEIVGEKTQVVPQGYKKSEVLRKSESSTTEGFGVTYIDEHSDGARDTIKILIPPPKVEMQTEKTEGKEEKKFLDISTDANKQESSVVVTEPKAANPATVVAIKKNSCPSLANENDFFKLRKTMAGEADDAGMLSEAAKVFKKKCFTTEQIKNLSTLFLKDDGKYKFFDAAYLYVSDLENFPALQNELKDEYYLNRFKAMLR
ncbi:MAG: DUF4476 domain-containing protein [Bacteroidetes bacterium]|nr:MAG: DUF4476 domain-containing protein [Bacteroidota bacterium]